MFAAYPIVNNEKTAKVKFKDDLISFEPEDLTDDDVNSIESDHADIISPTPDYKTTIISHNDPNIFNIEEIEEEYLEEEEIIEEIGSDPEILETIPVRSIDSINKIDKNINSEKFSQDSQRIESSSKESLKSSKRRKGSKFKFLNPSEVHCKEHCIDKLDFDLSMSIKKLEIHEKVQLPPLQLLQRKCCDEVRQKTPKNLPNYNGLRSEYGLTSKQLAKRQKQQEVLKMREEMRQRLITEYRTRRIQQNEEVFCQWLKEVARRKAEKQNTKKPKYKESVVPNVIILPNKTAGRVRERPKTANEFIPRTTVKKPRRPHTTQSCVYIEIPPSVLHRGLNIGDLIIRNSKLFNRNNLLLTVS